MEKINEMATSLSVAKSRKRFQEDPNVEINAIKELLDNKMPLNICIIASAGDTLCSLVVHQSKAEFGKIDVIDTNTNRLYTVKLKLALVQSFNVDFFTNGYNKIVHNNNLFFTIVLDHLKDSKLIDRKTYEYWLINIDLLANWDMSLYLLQYSSHTITYPINFFHMNIMDHLKIQKDASYDLIQLSNMIDCLDSEIFCELVNEVGRTLTAKGKAIIRRLGSSTNLVDYFETFYNKYGKYKFIITKDVYDKSYFYSEILIITKL